MAFQWKIVSDEMMYYSGNHVHLQIKYTSMLVVSKNFFCYIQQWWEGIWNRLHIVLCMYYGIQFSLWPPSLIQLI
jgi:hypothetical protein